ncbi:MAG: GntR family transcriptional regulator [Oscillospiraceae bacterium]|nr:GntR family transcriptional regulator [Oscillospiraceae bacterium]
MSGYANHINGVDIYNKLKDDILNLRLKPGQMISENEVASIYNVSRTPIKTAFLRLKGEKYIEIIPQKGSFITLLDMKFIKDIIYMRFVLEMDMINNILDNANLDKLAAALEDNLAAQQKLIALDEVTPSAFYDIDSAFHYALFEAVGREKMWDVIQDCQVYYTRFRILDTLATSRYQELHRDHEDILQALKAGDRQRLRTLVFDHLHGNLRRLAPKIEGEFKNFFVQYD